jgi:hypothetical protein
MIADTAIASATETPAATGRSIRGAKVLKRSRTSRTVLMPAMILMTAPAMTG